jgi:hypothetical protein
MDDLFIKLIICLNLALILVGCSDPKIIVIKEVNKNFQLPSSVQIKSFNKDWERKKNIEKKSFSEIGFARGTTAMNWFIAEALKPIGVEESYDDSNLRIECNFNYGHCYPFLGRHFEVYFTAITDVNIKIVDLNGEVFGEAQYIGSWQRMPMDELMAKMIGAILKINIPLESHSLNRDDIKSVKVTYAPKASK